MDLEEDDYRGISKASDDTLICSEVGARRTKGSVSYGCTNNNLNKISGKLLSSKTSFYKRVWSAKPV